MQHSQIFSRWTSLIVLFSFFTISPTQAQDEAKDEKSSDSKKPPPVQKIGETRYRLGEVEFDAKTREIFLPVIVNMREGGPIEYLLVHENGKVHESVFTTTASPMALQLACKLLKYKSGTGDLFNVRLSDEEKDSKSGKMEERGNNFSATIKFEGSDDVLPAHKCILDGRKEGAPMADEGWVYTGSQILSGSFMAEVEGSIIAVYLDDLAIMNTPTEGGDDDERWAANGEVIPEVGTKGTMILK